MSIKRLTADDPDLIPKFTETYCLKIYARLRELEMKIAAGEIITREMSEKEIEKIKEESEKEIEEIKSDLSKKKAAAPKADTKTDKEKADKKSGIKYQRIIDSYNDICVSLPKSRVISDTKRALIKARFNDGYKYDDFKTVFTNAEASDLLTRRKPGKGHESFKANFDWLLKPANFEKVLENCYESEAKETLRFSESDFEEIANANFERMSKELL